MAATPTIRKRQDDAGDRAASMSSNRPSVHEARRQRLGAQHARVKHRPGREREHDHRQRGDAPVGDQPPDQERECRHERQHQRQRQQPAGADGGGPGPLEPRDVGCGRNFRQRNDIERAQPVEQPGPPVEQHDLEIARMIEVALRAAVVQQEDLIGHHVIHIGTPPIWIEIAGHEERDGHRHQAQQQRPGEAEQQQAADALLRTLLPDGP